MKISLAHVRRAVRALIVAVLTVCFFAWPGAALVRDLADPALSGPGMPRRALALHRDLTPASKRGPGSASPKRARRTRRSTTCPPPSGPCSPRSTTCCPPPSSRPPGIAASAPAGSLRSPPLSYAPGAVDAARDLILDPSHHTWVKTHWGPRYMHREDVFFRSLVVAGLTAHEQVTRDGSSLPVLRDQVETLAAELDESPLGLLNDEPGECYPIDVLAAVGLLRRADAGREEQDPGVSHPAQRLHLLAARQAHPVGHEPQGVGARPLEGAHGAGHEGAVIGAEHDLWPDRAARWYGRYEASFCQDRTWAAGFREYGRGSAEPAWTFEIDAGLVLDGFGTAASAFGVAAARRNGRFDHAYTLATELSAASWALPGGTLLFPRLFSHAAAAPYLGESAILYFLTVQPAPGVPVVRGSPSGLDYHALKRAHVEPRPPGGEPLAGDKLHERRELLHVVVPRQTPRERRR